LQVVEAVQVVILPLTATAAAVQVAIEPHLVLLYLQEHHIQ
jgi:hypothetical protein